MKVRANATYIYRATYWDRFDPKTFLKDGTRVRVVKLHGCPPPNTMGHAHVAMPEGGRFLGLVSTASLYRS